MEHTLEVFTGETLVFFSNGKWLYPLFELEDFLATGRYEPATLTVSDKIIGKAAALLVIRLGIRDVRAGIMSKLGMAVLKTHGIHYEYSSLVERIDCETEEILANECDPEKAYIMLKKRAGHFPGS